MELSWNQACSWVTARCRAGIRVLLKGPMGVGKSTLARHILRALTQQENLAVPSPTFSLILPYSSASGIPIFHMDLYRLENEEDFWLLGIHEMMDSSISIIEWPEKLPPQARGKHILALELSLCPQNTYPPLIQAQAIGFPETSDHT